MVLPHDPRPRRDHNLRITPPNQPPAFLHNQVRSSSLTSPKPCPQMSSGVLEFVTSPSQSGGNLILRRTGRALARIRGVERAEPLRSSRPRGEACDLRDASS